VGRSALTSQSIPTFDLSLSTDTTSVIILLPSYVTTDSLGLVYNSAMRSFLLYCSLSLTIALALSQDAIQKPFLELDHPAVASDSCHNAVYLTLMLKSGVKLTQHSVCLSRKP